MKLMKTDKEVLTNDDILKYIADYESKEVPELNRLWNYFIGENSSILARKKVDENNPDNRIVIAYGRKIVNTFTGYAFRPKYITYKAKKEDDHTLDETENVEDRKEITKEELYVKQLQEDFNLNNEHIKTSRAGRNIAIFGLSYEVMYIDNKVENIIQGEAITLSNKIIPKFFTVDPREIILLYDFDPEPKKKIAIRFYKVDINKDKVEVYYKDKILLYERIRDDNFQYTLVPDPNTPENINWFGDIPVVPFYFGDEMLGVIKVVTALIDALDVLYSDSMNEFDRFAFAYLIMKKYALTDPVKMKTPGLFSRALSELKRKRIFENVPEGADIKFLTKDIPTEFIEYMKKAIKDEIHNQSHVPDFTLFTGTLSGATVDRLLFDFENMVSSNEADFDLGLLERIRLMNLIYARTSKIVGDNNMITITHERNKPNNLQEFASTALTLKQAGFSSYLVCDSMPDDILPNIQIELARQKKEADELIEGNSFGMNEPEEVITENVDEESIINKGE